MALKAPSGNNTSRQIAPEGAFVARCYQIVDLGTTMQTGQFPGKKRKVQFIFELPTETHAFEEGGEEKPFYARSIYNLSMNEKAVLRRDIESWAGKKMTNGVAEDFDIFTLIGRPCMVNLTHVVKGDITYANIIGISPVPKGLVCPPAFNAPLCYNTEEHDDTIFAQLPEFIQDKMKMSDEWIARVSKPLPASIASRVVAASTESAEFQVETEDDGFPF
jgi:hypothetical protein